jgi:hypothetical protein
MSQETWGLRTGNPVSSIEQEKRRENSARHDIIDLECISKVYRFLTDLAINKKKLRCVPFKSVLLHQSPTCPEQPQYPK